MKKYKFGFIQGRVSRTPKKNILQFFPQKNWKNEFSIAKKISFNFIEYIGERKFNIKNPIWSLSGLNSILKLTKKNKLINYSFCDDYFINNNLMKYQNLETYFKKISENLFTIKVKIYVLALFEKSEITEKNYIFFVKKLKKIADIFSKKKIILALELNLKSNKILKLIKMVNKKNLFVVYDTGNRLKKGKLQYNEIIKLKKKIIHVHLKDKNFKGQNVVLGSGAVDFSYVFKALNKIKYKGMFAFETNRGDNPILTMINNKKFILKNLNYE